MKTEAELSSSPKELAIPDYVKTDVMDKCGMEYVETTDLEAVMPTLDVLYMTRVQKERFADENEYLRLKDSYILTVDKIATAKKDMCILHPLPRVNEIEVAIDKDPRACYFKQVENGRLMRMALILKLLGLDEELSCDKKQTLNEQIIKGYTCKNPRCITTIEQELEQAFKLTENGTYRCIYCEETIE